MRNSDVLLDKIYDVSNSYSEFITVDCYLPSPSERVRLKVQEKEYYRKERREALLRSCIFGESIKRQQVSQEELNQFKVGDKTFENLLIKNLENSSIVIERSVILPFLIVFKNRELSHSQRRFSSISFVWPFMIIKPQPSCSMFLNLFQRIK